MYLSKIPIYLLFCASVAHAQTVATSKSSYASGEAVQISWTGASSTADWFGIYPQGVNPGGPASLNWIYTSGSQTKPASVIASGSANMTSGLAPGNYSVFMCANDGYTVRASDTFSVGASGPSVAATPTFAGDTITVNFTGAPGNQTDWIAIYQQGQTGSNFLKWVYLNGATSGSVAFSGLAAGNYDLYLYQNDTYQSIAQGVVTITPNALIAGNAVFSDNENASFTYQFSDTQNDHWVGVYPEGATNENFLTSINLGGADSGSSSLTALPPARYELRTFKAGTYDKVGAASFLVRDDHRQATWVSLPNRHQTHAVGSSGTINGYADGVWKASNNHVGVLSSTTGTRMRAGSYHGMVQIIHTQNQVKSLGKLQALVNGQIIAEKNLYSNPIANLGDYDCLYESLPFTLSQESDVTLRVTSIQGNGGFSTGVMSMFRTTDKRPLHVIAHRKNNIQRVNTAVSQGATGVEIDTDTVSVGGQLRLKAHHHAGEVDWTPYDQYGALLDVVKGHMNSGALTMVYFDIKDPEAGQTYEQYATELYSMLQARGFDPSRVVVGTFQPVAFRTVAQSMNYPVNIDFYNYGGRYSGWIKDAEQHSTIQEFGQPEASTQDTQDLVQAIYTSGRIRTCYVWSFYNDVGYYDNTATPYSADYSKTLARRMMILGVNGVMPDQSSSMVSILSEPAFQGAFRIANTNDRVSYIHGEN